ncbi:MAG: HAMP domain-containing protein [Phycisphaerales bacterium]|nr:MAG: HAMP domain-containing protein [Phycisphaerales bacterium]
MTLIVAGTALNLWMERGVQADAGTKATAAAADIADIIRQQRDEDFLIEPMGRRAEFETLRVPFAHWLIMREGGAVEVARGILAENPLVTLGVPAQPMQSFGRTAFTVASVPLTVEAPLGWDDIPTRARTTVESLTAGGTLIGLRRVVLGQRILFDIKVLYPDHVQAVEVTDAGELLENRQRGLPDRLSQGQIAALSLEPPLRDIQVTGWRAYNGELVALVEGGAPDGETVQTAVNRFGERYIVADGRIVQLLEQSRLWVAVAYDMTADLAGLSLFARATVAGGTLLWLLIILLAWQVTRRALKPVDEIVTRTARIDAPHLGERLPVGAADDELSRIARTVNRMLDRIQDGYRREQQFTGDASHEMRNPLAKMLGEIDWALSRQRAPQEYRDTLERLQRYAQSMQQLTESLLILARLDGKLQNLEVKPFDVADLAMELLGTFPADSAGRLRLELGESTGPMEALGHRHLIAVLMRNLIDNALRYSPAQSPVDLRIHRANGRIDVAVQDAGPGIPPEQVALAFNRFYRLEPSRSRQTGGVGLGLSIAQVIATVHHTEVNLGPAATGGTLATFTLPSADGDTKRSAPSSA